MDSERLSVAAVREMLHSDRTAGGSEQRTDAASAGPTDRIAELLHEDEGVQGGPRESEGGLALPPPPRGR